MNEGIPRPLLVLTAIVVLVAVFIGVKDYLQKPKEAPATATAIPSDAPSNPTTVPQKAASAKLKRVRISALAGNAANTLDSAADTEKSSVSKESGEAGGETSSSNDYTESSVAQAARDGADVAMELQGRQGGDIDARIVRLLFTPPKCVPLPNLVISGDVDAPYYENWAREYSCRLR